MKLKNKTIGTVLALIFVIGAMLLSASAALAEDAYKGSMQNLQQAAGHAHCVCGANKDIGDHTSHSDVEFTPWTSDNSMPTEPGSYVLTCNVTLSETWLPKDGTVLCLGGYTLSVEESEENSQTIWVRDINIFTLCDCSGNKGSVTGGFYSGILIDSGMFYNYGGSIKGNGLKPPTGSSAADGIVVNLGASMNMYGGIVTENGGEKSKVSGGIANYGTIVMHGGLVTGNYTRGIYNRLSFTMKGGEISGNDISSLIEDDDRNSGAGVYSKGQFVMEGGVIKNNAAGVKGGGIANLGELKLLGGSIIGNSAAGIIGGGVWNSPDAVVSISGDAVISQNSAGGAESNLCLTSDGEIETMISVGETTEGANIGISIDETHGELISLSGNKYASSFFSDKEGLAVEAEGEGLKLALPHKHSFTKVVVEGDEHRKICEICGETDVNTVEQHSGGTATCTKKAICAICGADYGQALGHSFEWVTDKEPTTSEEGVKHEECKACGERQNEGTSVPSLGSPPTGDATLIVALLLAISATLTVALAARKRRI